MVGRLSPEAAIEASLRRVLEGVTGRLGEAAAYVALAPGKRVRPLLCLHACVAAGGVSDDALPFATAIELVHAMSLVHDDLPSMDAATTRRGRPCCHLVYGEALAILVGDALLAHAFGVVARMRPTGGPHVAAELVELLADACAFAGLAGGQALELELSGAADVGPPARHAIVAGKTAALFRAAARGGALVARASPDVVERLSRFGDALGHAFQALDDCLDHHPDHTGKTGGRDAAHGRPTRVRAEGYGEAARLARVEIDAACADVALLGPAAHALCALARRVEMALTQRVPGSPAP